MFSRSLRTKSIFGINLRYYARRILNPGVGRRLKAFEEEHAIDPSEDVEELVDSSESDIYKIEQAHEIYEKESKRHRERLQLNIVKRKYFSETLPNLLTWSEKEQIRSLYAENPKEWTPERLAESFPVTVEVVKKLVAYSWKPASQHRIERHDTSAMRNWKELKEGTLEIPKELRKEFLKFADRVIPPLRRDPNPEEVKALGEFQAIVDRCANKTKTKANKENKKSDDLRISSASLLKERVTLDELKRNIDNKSSNSLPNDSGTNVPDETYEGSTAIARLEENEKYLKDYEERSQDRAIGYVKKEAKDLSHFKEESHLPKEEMKYPERIQIPENAWKLGGTYRVNDCYYDDDGEFLYRVPGMSADLQAKR